MQNSAGASSAQFIKMTQTPIPKLIVTLAAPTVASMLVSSIYNLADTFFVGQLKSNSATGAVGVVFSLMAILQAFGFMVGMGSGSVISRLLGRQEGQKASHIASMGFFTSLGCGALLGIGGLIFLEPLMRLLGATDTILPYACDYGRYILAAAPLMCASFTMNNMLRYEGKAAFAMIGLTTGGILNILLDPLFIFVFDMGIAGAALATALSQCVSFCLLLAMFLVGKSQLRLSVRLIGRDLPGLKNILACGLPSFARQALASVATALLNWQAGQCGGDAAVAADDAVFALGRGGGDDDVLKEAVLFHALDGGEELLVLRHGEAVHGVVLEVRNAQLADKLAVDGAGGLGGLLQRPEDGRRFLARHAQPSIRSSISSHSAA